MIIDCDSHIIPTNVYQRVSEKYRHLLPSYTFDNAGQLTNVEFDVDPATLNNNPAPLIKGSGVSNIEYRLADLKRLKVDMQLLCPQELAMRFNYSVKPKLAAEMAHSYNQAIKEIVDAHPTKFFATALIPMQDVELALEEIKWSIDNGFTAIHIDLFHLDTVAATSIPWSTVAGIESVFELCEKNKIVVYMHSMMHHIDTSQEPFKLMHRGPVLKWHAVLYDLVTSGLLDQFPALKIVIAEIDRWNLVENTYNNLVGYSKMYQGRLKFKKPPIHYFRNNIHIAIDIEQTQSVKFMVDTFGSQQILFSTDYPHDDPGGTNKWKDVDDLLAFGLSQEDLKNISYQNAQRLFRLVL